jgi:hypothetical protein
MTENSKPAHKIRSQALTLTIWKKSSDKEARYSVTARGSYKKGEQWAERDSFNQEDLLRLAKLLDEANSWIKCRKAFSARAAGVIWPRIGLAASSWQFSDDHSIILDRFPPRRGLALRLLPLSGRPPCR